MNKKYAPDSPDPVEGLHKALPTGARDGLNVEIAQIRAEIAKLQRRMYEHEINYLRTLTENLLFLYRTQGLNVDTLMTMKNDLDGRL